MTNPIRAYCTLAAALAILLPPHATRGQQTEDRKPSLSLRVMPPAGFSPLRVRVVADLRDGSDDYEEFYCATVEWEWGDDTISENSIGCDPYEAGKSQIRRRYSAEHIFRQSGRHRIYFKLKQKDDVVAAASVNVQVRGGIGDRFGR